MVKEAIKQENKKCLIAIYLSKEEKQKIKSIAKARGLSTSSLLRVEAFRLINKEEKLKNE